MIKQIFNVFRLEKCIIFYFMFHLIQPSYFAFINKNNQKIISIVEIFYNFLYFVYTKNYNKIQVKMN